MIRLNKLLSKCGVASRRTADRMILQGRIAVNGEKVKELGVVIDEQVDRVSVDEKEISIPVEAIYILLSKPKGYITSMKDRFGRKPVIDLVKNVGRRVYPVGRLDLDTEGLLLLTDDGELAYRLTHPKYNIKKVYQATVKGQFPPEEAVRFEAGIKLEDGHVASGKAKLVSVTPKYSVLQVEMVEGHKREVRRMCKTLGFPVINLRRTRFADLSCEGMKVGTWRFLSRKEVEKLRKKVDLE